MNSPIWGILLAISIQNVKSYKFDNFTVQPAARQLLDFKLEHPEPIGLWTTTSGEPVEIRENTAQNTDIISNQVFLDLQTINDGERVPERIVHAKGTGAYGYFVVTNDVSKYTKADVFNGIGKKTPLVVRFSSSVENLGGTDLKPEMKGMAVKFYTEEGNLDLLCLQNPVYFYRDAFFFSSLAHGLKRNPQTNLFDFTLFYDIITLRPNTLHAFMWTQSEYGIPNGYRKMNGHPIHTYEVNNRKGEKFYVKFNFRTEQGLDNLTRAETIQLADPDYYIRDLYNAIENKNYPSWRLEMDVMTFEGVKEVDYDPFDVTRLWKNGTYITVPIGRLVLNRNVKNVFRDVELSAFNPGNLVPGIPGPPDFMFKTRRLFYRDTQNYRLGRNHNKIDINKPKYAKLYSRDGKPPVDHNMENAPNYYPNSFNGPIPYVDESKPREKLLILQSNAVDFEPHSYFYNHVLVRESQKQRLVDNLAVTLVSVTSPVLERTIKLMYLIDKDLGRRLTVALELARVAAAQRAQAIAARNGELTPIKRKSDLHSEDSKDVKLQFVKRTN
ncbi:catalase [Bombyx mori]|uniref:Catalase core domain-containing protein n=1 Tax=Bombyx mori TaxID=7091 RepID=A0A8R1WKY1_BOMMO|nr:catalase [Bombyx mori]